MGISQETSEKFQGLIKSIAEAVSKVCKWLKDLFRDKWEWLKTAAAKWYQSEEEKKTVVRQHHKKIAGRSVQFGKSFDRGGDLKTLQTELVEKGLSEDCASGEKQKNTRAKMKSSESLSDRELRELMGVHRDTYKRVGGAIRKR